VFARIFCTLLDILEQYFILSNLPYIFECPHVVHVTFERDNEGDENTAGKSSAFSTSGKRDDSMIGNNFGEPTEPNSSQARHVLCRSTAQMEGLAVGLLSSKIPGRIPLNLVSLGRLNCLLVSSELPAYFSQ
jgi:hypothetical protein